MFGAFWVVLTGNVDKGHDVVRLVLACLIVKFWCTRTCAKERSPAGYPGVDQYDYVPDNRGDLGASRATSSLVVKRSLVLRGDVTRQLLVR